MIAGAVLREQSSQLTLSSVRFQSSFSQLEPDEVSGLTTLAAVEKKHILTILSRMNGNRTQAAKVLGIGRKTLQRKLKAYQLEN